MNLGELARELRPAQTFPGLSLRQATVTAVDTAAGTVTVKVGASTGAIAGVKYLASTVLVVGDSVWLLQNGPDLLVLGRLAVGGTQGNTTTLHGGLELYHSASTPHIDFHRAANAAGDAAADYDIRLINDPAARLTVRGGDLVVEGKIGAGPAGTGTNFEPLHTAGSASGISMRQRELAVTDDTNRVVLFPSNGALSFWMGGATRGVWGIDYLTASIARIGYAGFYGDFACFAHSTRWAAGQYALLQAASGETYINTYVGNLWMRYQNADRLSIDVNGIVARSPFTLLDNRIYTRGWNDLNHYMSWNGGIDGLYAKEYGGFQFDTRDGMALRIDIVNVHEHRKFDQLSNWTTYVIRGKSEGGQSSCGVALWEAGRGSAPIMKSWFEAMEFRNNPNTGWLITRSIVENYSSKRSKANIKSATERLTRPARKDKVKRLRSVHFTRDTGVADGGAYGGCANCKGTGKRRDNEHLITSPDEETPDPDDDSPCPTCDGQGRAWRRPHEKKNEEAGWFGFLSEEVEPEFPEAVFYRQDEDGVVRPSGLDALALIAILWEEVKELGGFEDSTQERLAKNEARLTNLERGRPA